MADLAPTVDRLVHSQQQNAKAIQKLTQSVGKINLGVGEMRTSNLHLADAIEKLIAKN